MQPSKLCVHRNCIEAAPLAEPAAESAACTAHSHDIMLLLGQLQDGRGLPPRPVAWPAECEELGHLPLPCPWNQDGLQERVLRINNDHINQERD